MATPTELLINPHPNRHIVYPCNDEEKAANALHVFTTSGLLKEESVVLIMADSRRETTLRRLADGGFDLAKLQASEQLQCISADGMLRTFMLNDLLFHEVLGRVIQKARASSPIQTVRVFGDMVSLLLARKEVAAAERLEELWNEIIESHSISLLCSYALLDSDYTILPPSLEALHSHNLALGSERPW